MARYGSYYSYGIIYRYVTTLLVAVSQSETRKQQDFTGFWQAYKPATITQRKCKHNHNISHPAITTYIILIKFSY